MSEEKKKIDDRVVEEKPLNKVIVIEKLYSEKNVREKLCYIREHITVEPMLAGLIIPSVISMFAMGNLNLDKACRVNLAFGDEVCEALIKKNNDSYGMEEKAVQQLIASIDIWKGIIKTLLPCIIIMFLGAWSDRTGKRKIIILLPVFGEVLTSINNIVNVYFFYEIPVQVTVLLETLCLAVTGGWVTMFLGVFSFISDITSEETRTFRVGLVNICMTAGLPIGLGLSGILLREMGYYGIFSMTAVLFVIVLLYGWNFLMEPDDWLKEKGLPVLDRSNNEKVSFFNFAHMTDTLNVALRKRYKTGRAKILLTLFTLFILYGPAMSEHSVFYLYLRNQLNWDMVKFSVYTSYSIVLHSIGAMFSLTILSKRLQIDDSLLCLISVASKFAGSVWIAFARTDIEMYLVPVAELLNATTITSLRSIISKLVEKDEIAKVNSLFSLTETLASLVFSPLYSWMYMRTLYVLPGAVFLTSAALTIPAACVLTLFYVQHRRQLKKARRRALEAEDKKENEANKKDIPVDKFQISEIKEKTNKQF